MPWWRLVVPRAPAAPSSYLQWREEGIAPQVVFEVLSPGNTKYEMVEKLGFYERYGVEEYYLWDPDSGRLQGWMREGADLAPVFQMEGHQSSRLGVRFEVRAGKLELYGPDGSRFLSYVELKRKMEWERRRAEQERQRALVAEQAAEREKWQADEERRRADEERRRALVAEQAAEREKWQAEQERQRALVAEKSVDRERERADLLAERLRQVGIDPHDLH